MPACTCLRRTCLSGLEGDEEGDAEQREEDGHASEDGELLLAHGRAREEGLHDELHTTKQTVAGGGGAKAKVTAPVNTSRTEITSCLGLAERSDAENWGILVRNPK